MISVPLYFTFINARAILPYLQRLGISHFYASLIFKARRGSSHEYDIADPRVLNPKLGIKDHFDSLLSECSAAGIGLIQDIIPNHMTLNADNPFFIDILENGSISRYYSFVRHRMESSLRSVLLTAISAEKEIAS